MSTRADRAAERAVNAKVGAGPLLTLGALAVILLAAGVLPWTTGGSGAARGLAVPLVLLGLLAGYAVLRAARYGVPTSRPATRDSAPPAGCAGCACGENGCAGARAAQ